MTSFSRCKTKKTEAWAKYQTEKLLRFLKWVHRCDERREENFTNISIPPWSWLTTLSVTQHIIANSVMIFKLHLSNTIHGAIPWNAVWHHFQLKLFEFYSKWNSSFLTFRELVIQGARAQSINLNVIQLIDRIWPNSIEMMSSIPKMQFIGANNFHSQLSQVFGQIHLCLSHGIHLKLQLKRTNWNFNL